MNVPCSYAANQVGEREANLPLLLQKERGNTTPFAVEPQGAAMYVNGNPTPNDPALRQLQRDTAALTANNPYSGVNGEKIINYQAGAVEQRILHMQTADPLRTPSYTMFPQPDYYFDPTFPKCGSSTDPATDCATTFAHYAWNHGYYAPDVDITWAGIVGPGVAKKGLLGPDPSHGATATADGQNGRPALTVPGASSGPWVEETDIRPTLLSLTGLRDDYLSDGAVLTGILTGHHDRRRGRPGRRVPPAQLLGRRVRDGHAEGGHRRAGQLLDRRRDVHPDRVPARPSSPTSATRWPAQIKQTLDRAEFGPAGRPVRGRDRAGTRPDPPAAGAPAPAASTS